jgi:hypothetical protein
MPALVVYESMFGNTKRIALAVADGIATRLPVRAVEVGDAPEEIGSDVDLLVVGGPTHAHGMSSASSRRSAAERGSAVISSRLGIREWLDHAHTSHFEIPAAAFDTRVNIPELLSGSAAKGYVKGLRSAGFQVRAKPHSFLIAPKAPQEDGLLPGELEAARAWGAQIATALGPRP